MLPSAFANSRTTCSPRLRDITHCPMGSDYLMRMKSQTNGTAIAAPLAPKYNSASGRSDGFRRRCRTETRAPPAPTRMEWIWRSHQQPGAQRHERDRTAGEGCDKSAVRRRPNPSSKKCQNQIGQNAHCAVPFTLFCCESRPHDRDCPTLRGSKHLKESWRQRSQVVDPVALRNRTTTAMLNAETSCW